MGIDKKDNPNKRKPEEFSTTQMFFTAKAFLSAAKRCNEPSFKELGWAHHLIVPIVTNVSFSCELFLKTILREENKFPREHNLHKLFVMLSEKTQKDIIGEDDNEEFISILIQNSCLFEEWRYIYEYHLRSLNISFLFDFAERLSVYTDHYQLS